MCYAVSSFIEEKMGPRYVENRTMEFAKSFEEASPTTPIFFILSPGVNPLKDVEALGHVLGYTADNNNFHNVSLGMQFVTRFTCNVNLMNTPKIMLIRSRARSCGRNSNGYSCRARSLGYSAEYSFDKEMVANIGEEDGLLCRKFT